MGSNIKIYDIDPTKFDYMWIEDTLIGDHDIGWNKNVDQVTESANPGPEFTNPDHIDKSSAAEKLMWLSTKSYQEVEDYIMANVTDLPSARDYLIDLSKTVLAIIKTAKEII